MNTRNRIASLLMVAALACSMLLFSACGGEPKGEAPADLTDTTWVLSGGSQGSTKVSKEDMEAVFGGELSYSFKAEGVASMALAGTDLAEGTWTQDGNSITLTLEGQESALTLDGDTLSIVQGDVTVLLSKQ